VLDWSNDFAVMSLSCEKILSLLQSAFQAPELTESQPWFSVRQDPIAALAASLALEDEVGHCLPPALLLTHPDATALAGFLRHPSTCFHEFQNVTFGDGDQRVVFIHGDPNMGGLYLPALAASLPGVRLEVIIEPDILVRPHPYSHRKRLAALMDQPPFRNATPPAALGGYCNGGLAALQIAPLLSPGSAGPGPVFWIHPHQEARALQVLDRALQCAEALGICPPEFALKCVGRLEDEYWRRTLPGSHSTYYNELLLQRPIAHRHRALTRRLDLIRKRDQILARLIRRCRTPHPSPLTIIFHPASEPLKLSFDLVGDPRIRAVPIAGNHNRWNVEDVASCLYSVL
jgi:hypothetical protein